MKENVTTLSDLINRLRSDYDRIMILREIDFIKGRSFK